ncbi:DUF4898 domain-containing protein [Sulfurisphaera tokodaii]|uniref:DUF4898 domain-containing protein n=1 Tax=Sulfurisphaera tokodaii TaxID=111955 RepID=A0A832TI27_9CREN|nr:DUF4898 domain-containing protein [Sulfurisphaera tokodaii]HII74536.1 DUF4898 domain-containing protein [Sulfurisphaera tokodaii]
MINLDSYVEANIKDMIKIVGCNECYLYKFNLILDYSKFLSFIISDKKTLAIIFPSGRSDREVLISMSKNIARSKNISLYAFLSDLLREDSFIICYRR